jgi:hypothetical protein
MKALSRCLPPVTVILGTLVGLASCKESAEDAAPVSDPTTAASAPAASAAPLSGEALAKANREAWDAGRAYLDKLERLHESVPRGGAGTKKCDDARIRKDGGSAVARTVIVMDEPLLTYLATGKKPAAGDDADWAWLRSPIWLEDIAELRAEGDAYDPAKKRGSLQKAAKYLPKQRYAAVVRVVRRELPSEKNGKLQAGVFHAQVFIMDVEAGDLLCQTTWAFDAGTAVTFREGPANATPLELTQIQFKDNASSSLRKALEEISEAVFAPPSLRTEAPPRIP